MTDGSFLLSGGSYGFYECSTFQGNKHLKEIKIS